MERKLPMAANAAACAQQVSFKALNAAISAFLRLTIDAERLLATFHLGKASSFKPEKLVKIFLPVL